MEQIILSKQAQAALQVGFKNHWRFRILGSGDVPASPVYKDSWWLTLAEEIPDDGERRISAIRRAGIPVKAIVMAHEAPKALTATPEPQKMSVAQNDANDMLAGILWAVALFFQAALVDPALIVVLEDGTWLEVMTWLE